MRISVVIPVYNSEQSLGPLVARLQPVLDSLTNVYELIFVNDGSRDASWDVICELRKQHAWIVGIDLMRNAGQHNAVLCGIRAARYEITVTIDDDLQHPPEEIPKLIEKFKENVDVVYGTPQKQQHGLWRDLASVMTKVALKTAMGVDVARNVNPFRAFKTHIRQAFADYNGSFVSIDVLLSWGATRFAAVPVKHDKRELGVSNYTFKKLVTHAMNMVTGFSTLPLQIASLVGFLLAGFGGIILASVLIRHFIEGSVVPGFAFLASLISIFSGAQLFALGVLGEYIARMHFRLMDRPCYIINPESTPFVERQDRTISLVD